SDFVKEVIAKENEVSPVILLSYDKDFNFDDFGFKANNSEVFIKTKNDLVDYFKNKYPDYDYDSLKYKFILIQDIRLDISLLKFGTNELDIESFKNSKLYRDFSNAIFIDINAQVTENYNCKREVGKMSKSWLNVVNPDDIANEYGA